MDSMDDPSSSPFLGFEEPMILDANFAGTMADNDLGFGSTTHGTPDFCSSAYRSHNNLVGSGAVVNPADLALPPLRSRESFPESSSSDFTNDPNQRNSSDSSRSDPVLGDGRTKIEDSASPYEGITIGGSSPVAQPTRKRPSSIDIECSNRAMESQFDFDSAASSPILHPSTKQSLNIASKSRGLPMRPNPTVGVGYGMKNENYNQAGFSMANPNPSSPSLRMRNQGAWPSAFSGTQPADPKTFGNRDYRTMTAGLKRESNGPCEYSHGAFVPPGTFWPSAESLATDSKYSAFSPSLQPTLSVKPLPSKTRVETQIHVKMTLYSAPTGISKLHFQPHTICKSKFLAKSGPFRSPEMLELHAMLVCTSAMQDPEKEARAQARARASHAQSVDSGNSHSSGGDPFLVTDEEMKPINGGPVQICGGCLVRERKRAARRTKKNLKEEEFWAKDEKKRIIVFNSPEIREWDAHKKEDVQTDDSDYAEMTHTNALHLDFPMRISCYCRHQEEKIGFRVIFTLKDHQDKVVAQTITTSIVITDDHKTNLTPGLSPVGGTFPDGVVIPGPSSDFHRSAFSEGALFTGHGSNVQNGVPVQGALPQNFPPTSYIHQPTSPFRNAYSSSDLQNIRHNFPVQQINPNYTQQTPFQTSSAAMTPKTRSMAASALDILGQQRKRRKASVSGRIPRDLAMTQLQTRASELPENQGPLSFNTHHQSMKIDTGSAHSSEHAASDQQAPFGRDPEDQGPPSLDAHREGNYINTRSALSPVPTIEQDVNQDVSEQQMPREVQHPTLLPSPISNDPHREFPSSQQRSYSMENLQGSHLAPGTRPPSGAPRATRALQANVLSFGHAQMPAYTPHAFDNEVQDQRGPTINKVNPSEGSKLGGYEITLLGSGFFQGIDVMFGNMQATTTTFWSPQALVCLVPPARQAGPVKITLRNMYQPFVPITENPRAIFNYIDDEDQALMKRALVLIERKINGSESNPSNAALNVLESVYGCLPGSSRRLIEGNDDQINPQNPDAASSDMQDLETAILSCLNLVDLDDSPFQPNFNSQASTGHSMLHISASLGYYRLTAGLLARGAYPDIRDRNGMSPMHLAALGGHHQVIRKLRSAGADPTLRSLTGSTPADIAISREAYSASNALEYRTRSRSAGATSTGYSSRNNSLSSYHSSYIVRSRISSSVVNDFEREDLEGTTSFAAHKSQSLTPNQMHSLSRRNSVVAEGEYLDDRTRNELASNLSLFSNNPAIAALRDQLSAQIQQLQQSVHRTLPTLQMPTLPPIPNLPDYQAYPVVRRISSLVPQRIPKSNAINPSSKTTTEAEYHWWELLTGATSPPPAYEDIYPNASDDAVRDKKASVLNAVGNILRDQVNRKEAESSCIMDTVNLGSPDLTEQQREKIRIAHAMKVKRLRSDRNLFFIWIPLLLLVLVAMLKDRAPKVVYGCYHAYQYTRNNLGGRVVEEL